MTAQNTINNKVNYLTLLPNNSPPIPQNGGILAVANTDLLYFKNTDNTYGLPLINNGGIDPQQGDTLAANASGSWELVPLGAEGYVWTAGATNSGWSPPAASPGLANFLCQTQENLPTNGINISASNSVVTFGITQANLPSFWQGASLTTYTSSSAPGLGWGAGFLSGDTSNSVQIGAYSSTGGGASPAFYGITNLASYASRGTISSPAAIQNNDILFAVDSVGQYGTAIDATTWVAGIRFVAEGNFTGSNAHPSGIRFYTASSGDAQSVERVKIGNTGLLTANYGISTTKLTMATGAAGTSGITSAITTSTFVVNSTAVTSNSIVMLTLGTIVGTPSAPIQISTSRANNINATSFQIDVELNGATSVTVNWFFVN